MRDNQFVHDTIKRFGDGLAKAMDAGTDTFSFEFDANEWPEDKPLLIQVAGNLARDEPLALLVLIRPKSAVDAMTEVMQRERELMLAKLAENTPAERPKLAGK